MKKLKVVNVLVLVFFLSSSLAYAEDMAGKFGVGANWFYYLSNNDEWNVLDVFGVDDIENEETAEVFNLHASYCLPDITDPVNLNVVLDYERISRDLTIDENIVVSDDLGELTMNPVMLTLQVRLSKVDKFTPYFGVGVGYSFNSFSEGDFSDDVEVDTDVDDSFCFKVPLGMDIYIINDLALNLEVKYFYTKPRIEGDFDIFDDEDEIDQSTFAFGTGVNYYF